MQESEAKLASGETTYVRPTLPPCKTTPPDFHRKSQEEHTALDSISRNRLSNVSFAVSSFGELVVLAIAVGILKGINSDENNTPALSIISAYSGGVWCEFLFLLGLFGKLTDDY